MHWFSLYSETLRPNQIVFKIYVVVFCKRSTFGKQVGLIQISNCYMWSYLVDNNAYFHVISFLSSSFFHHFSTTTKCLPPGNTFRFFSSFIFFFSKHGQISRFFKTNFAFMRHRAKIEGPERKTSNAAKNHFIGRSFPILPQPFFEHSCGIT